MNENMNILFSKLSIAGLSLKNRFVMNPVPTGFVENGHLAEENIEFYALRAQSVGLIIAGAININHPTSTNNQKVPNISSKNDLNIWKKITDIVHKKDCKIIAEIWHSGSSRNFADPEISKNVSSPSGVIDNKKIGSPLKSTEIKRIIALFAEAASNAKKAGFDGIDLHAGHGSLIHDFLVADTNKRVDKYSFKNRTKFATDIIKACRVKVGDNFPIFIRLSNFKMYDLSSKLADTVEDLKRIILPLSLAGVDCFDCSEISYKENAITNQKGNLAYWVKQITNKPVITTGGLGSKGKLYDDIPLLITEITKHPQLSYLDLQIEPAKLLNAEEILFDLKQNSFDLLGIGRPLLINENWLEELRRNQ